MSEAQAFTPPRPLNAAVLFLVFNRLDTTKQVFEAIRQAKPPRLYIAADGPRANRKGESDKVQAVRDFVMSGIDWECEIKTLFREENLGCKYGVSSGINWFFEHEEEGIILEDDVLPLPSFFDYCDELLDRYRDDSRIALISGCNLVSEHFTPNESYFFSRYNHIWGWASWRRAWQHYDVKMKNWPQWRDTGAIKNVSNGDVLFEHYWSEIFTRAEQGLIDTWDYQWTFACWSQNMISILPKYNQIYNLGFGQDATHTTTVAPSFVVDSVPQLLPMPLYHPEVVKVNQKIDRLINSIVFGVSFFSFVKAKIRALPLVQRLVEKLRR
jgi:hypothetical protein